MTWLQVDWEAPRHLHRGWAVPEHPEPCLRAPAEAHSRGRDSMQEPPTLAAPICSLRNFSSGVISTSLAFSICRAHTGKSHPQLPRHTVRSAPCPTPLLLPCGHTAATGLCWAKDHPPQPPVPRPPPAHPTGLQQGCCAACPSPALHPSAPWQHPPSAPAVPWVREGAWTPWGLPILGPYHAHPLVLQVPQHRGKLLQGLGCKGHTKRFST